VTYNPYDAYDPCGDPTSRAIEDLLKTLEARGGQYGQPDDDKANLRGALRVGADPIVGTYIRANDKHIRVQNLLLAAGSPGILTITPENRAQLRDNLLDIAGYAIKGMELLDERPNGASVPAAVPASPGESTEAPTPVETPEKGPDIAPDEAKVPVRLCLHSAGCDQVVPMGVAYCAEHMPQ